MADKDDHKVLKEHVAQGMKYVPVILTLGQFNAVPYVRIIIPELIWLAVLNLRLGNVIGAQVAQVIASTLKTVNHNPMWFGSISCLGHVPESTKQAITKALRDEDLTDSVESALSPFLDLYPEFPGRFLIQTQNSEKRAGFIQEIKTLLDQLYDTESGATVFMCANAIYAGFCQGFQVNEGVSLAQFPEIENYPTTELSMRIASACRSTALLTVGKYVMDAGLTQWSSYFWNHNLQLESIDWQLMRPQAHE